MFSKGYHGSEKFGEITEESRLVQTTASTIGGVVYGSPLAPTDLGGLSQGQNYGYTTFIVNAPRIDKLCLFY